MPKNETPKSNESSEETSVNSAELEKAALELITPEIQELIDNPISIKLENGEFVLAGMMLSGREAIELYHERFYALKPIREAIIKALEAKSKGTSASTSVAETVRNRIVEALSDTDNAEISEAIRKAYIALDTVSRKSDAHAIVISERLSHMAKLFANDANEAIQLADVPSDLREQTNESLISLFNDCHAAMKDLQKNTNGLFEGFHQNWAMYKEFFDTKLYRLNAKQLPAHPEDGRAMRSKYASDDENGETRTTRKYAHSKLDISIGYKVGNSKEIVRNLASDYRHAQFAMPSLMRELNRVIASKAKRPNFFPLDSSWIPIWIRTNNPELAQKSDTFVLATDWTITIPNTDIVVRRIPNDNEEQAK